MSSERISASPNLYAFAVAPQVYQTSAAQMTMQRAETARLSGACIGFGTAASFGPLIADISHWFLKRRGIAVAIAASARLGLAEPTAFVMAVMVAASSSFLTPVGYQTNLMVMGPGGYRWSDYTKFGGPLTLLAAVICIALVPLVFGFGAVN